MTLPYIKILSKTIISQYLFFSEGDDIQLLFSETNMGELSHSSLFWLLVFLSSNMVTGQRFVKKYPLQIKNLREGKIPVFLLILFLTNF